MKIKVITTGGTIDKEYFDALSDYQVGKTQVLEILREANASVDHEVVSPLQKDSLDLTDTDRSHIRDVITQSAEDRILVTHGTDTMIDTARTLEDFPGKTIVLTGALNPARFRVTDAVFNIGFAFAAVQLLPPGVYIAMNGQVFDPRRVRKNRDQNRFESTEG